MLKTEGLVKFPIGYLIHIKILWCHTVSTYLTQHLTWIWQQCVHIHHQNIRNHIGNVFFVVVHNVNIFIFQVQNEISTIPMLFQKYVFMCINKFICCNVHVGHPFNENKLCQLCKASYYLKVTARIYTRKDIFMMDTSIVDSHQQLYIPEI